MSPPHLLPNTIIATAQLGSPYAVLSVADASPALTQAEQQAADTI